MRILKKSLALLLALTMVLSLVVINVSAAAGTKYELNVGSATILKTAEDQVVDIPITIETDDVGICTFTVIISSEVGTLSDLIADEDLEPTVNKNTGVITWAKSSNKTFAAGTPVALAKVSVPADPEVGEYYVTLAVNQAKYVNESSRYSDAEFTVNAGKITVIEKQYINATEEVIIEDSVEYGASAPALPETVKGLGKKSNDNIITAEDNIDLDVEWDDIDTLQAPGEKTVNGTVAEPVSDTIEFKNDDYTEDVDSLTATANYTIAKSKAGVVAPVEIDVEARFGGEATDVEGIIALEEIEAVTSTTIKLEDADAEEETVELDWTNAEPADTGDATLNLGTAEDSIVLNVPLKGSATYYDLDGKAAAVTITVKPAVKMYNAIETVTVETAVEYGAQSGPALPATVKGLGETEGGQEITAENSDEFTVVWDAVDTLQAPGAKTVNGTVAEPADDLINFKNNDYTEDVDSLTATANYTIAKSKAGVVAPVATIEVAAKNAGVETGVEGLIVLEELTAVTSTTIAIDVVGAETETVELDWVNAEAASDADTTLNLGSDTDSIVLNVPVKGDTTYYDLDGKFVAVTVQMVPAWKYGDADKDGEVTGLDATVVLRHVAGYTEEINLAAADVDGDGEVTGLDATVILRTVAGFYEESELPLEP